MRSNYDSATLPYAELYGSANRATVGCLYVVMWTPPNLKYSLSARYIVPPGLGLSSVPGWIRTSDLLLRRQLLYPTELREQVDSAAGLPYLHL